MFLLLRRYAAGRARRGGFKHTNLTSGFCFGPKQLLAGQGAGRLSGLQRGLTHCDFTVVVTSQCLFCGFGATGLAGQGAGRLSGLQRGLSSMWLSV